LRPRYAQEVEVLEKPEFGVCSCGGMVMYHDDSGVRCVSCKKLYGTYNPNFKRKRDNLKQVSVDEVQEEEIQVVRMVARHL